MESVPSRFRRLPRALPRLTRRGWLLSGVAGVVLLSTAVATDVPAAGGFLAAATSEVLSIGRPAPAAGAQPQRDLADVQPSAVAAVTPQHVASAAPAAPRPVARPARLIQPDLLVLSRSSLPDRVRAQVAHADGVQATLTASAGKLRLAGHSVSGLAADPSALRRWAPKPTAASDGLWRNLAAGDLTTSFDLGRNLRLPLGGQVPARSLHQHAPLSLRLGALASLGLPGVDVTVAPDLGRTLGLTPNALMLVSAPHADLPGLRDALRRQLGDRADVLLLHEDVVVRDAGAFLTRAQITTVIAAAQSRLGAPYVWGATGPDSFDCSGLVGYAFAAAGIALPRTSEQLWFAGPHVPADAARPGDLLFWANDPAAPDDIDHVALYLGNGQMISAPHTGAVVHISAIPAANFRGIVRVDPAAAARVGGAQWAPGASRSGAGETRLTS